MSVWLWIEIGLVVLLGIAGAATPKVGPILGLEPPLVGTFAGALIGSAAAMLGAVLTQLAARAREQSAKADRLSAMKALITAELVNVAAGYVGLHETLRAAQRTLSAGGSVSSHPDFSREMPRSMPFTMAFGTELLNLAQPELDVLSTLFSNISLTQNHLAEISSGKRSFGLLAIRPLSHGVAQDLDLLAQAFEKFAPTRKLAHENRQAELASTLLRRLGNELKAGAP